MPKKKPSTSFWNNNKNIAAVAAASIAMLAVVALAASYSEFLTTRVAPGLRLRILGPSSIIPGKQATITWDISTQTATRYPYEKIEYCSSKLFNKTCTVLVSSTPNTGSVVVTIPSTLKKGRGYFKFTARDTTNTLVPRLKTYSGAVTVIPVVVAVNPDDNNDGGGSNDGGGGGSNPAPTTNPTVTATPVPTGTATPTPTVTPVSCSYDGVCSGTPSHISSVTPSSGPIGTTVTITGTGFPEHPYISFNGAPVAAYQGGTHTPLARYIMRDSATQLRFVVPQKLIVCEMFACQGGGPSADVTSGAKAVTVYGDGQARSNAVTFTVTQQ